MFEDYKVTHQVATPFQFRTVTFNLVFEAGGAFEAEDEADAWRLFSDKGVDEDCLEGRACCWSRCPEVEAVSSEGLGATFSASSNSDSAAREGWGPELGTPGSPSGIILIWKMCKDNFEES